MAFTGNCPVERPTVLGLVAATVWLVGLVVGGSALVAGDALVGGVSAVLALFALCMPGCGRTALPRWRGPTHRWLTCARPGFPRGRFLDRLVCNFFVFSGVNCTSMGYRLTYG